MTDDEDVVVAGGGLAGLVAARHLAEDGFDVTLFEREPEVGGRVRSAHDDGFTFDRGFQVLFTSYPAARRELDYGRWTCGRSRRAQSSAGGTGGRSSATRFATRARSFPPS